MKVSAQYAQQHLADLLETADHGQEIEIARDGRPLYKLTLVPVSQPAVPRKQIILGAGIGEMVVPTPEEWQKLKEEDAQYWDNYPLMTSGEV